MNLREIFDGRKRVASSHDTDWAGDNTIASFQHDTGYKEGLPFTIPTAPVEKPTVEDPSSRLPEALNFVDLLHENSAFGSHLRARIDMLWATFHQHSSPKKKYILDELQGIENGIRRLRVGRANRFRKKQEIE